MCLRFWCTDVPFPRPSDRLRYVPTNKPLRCIPLHDDDDQDNDDDDHDNVNDDYDNDNDDMDYD